MATPGRESPRAKLVSRGSFSRSPRAAWRSAPRCLRSRGRDGRRVRAPRAPLRDGRVVARVPTRHLGRRLESKGVVVESFSAGAESSTSATRCRGCGSRISGKYLVAPNGASYHPDCLACELCRARVRSFVSVKTRPDLLCCASCHDARFAETCARCRAPLRGSILSALGVKWHADCFRCSICDAPHVSTFVEHDGGACSATSRTSPSGAPGARGDRRRASPCARTRTTAGVSLRRMPRGRLTSYLTHDDRPWCRHVAVHAERCACDAAASRGSIVSAGQKYLDGHFRCAECRAFANGSSCAWRPARVARRTRPCATRVTPRTTRRSARCARQRYEPPILPNDGSPASRGAACARAPGAVCDDRGDAFPSDGAAAPPPSSSARRTARRASGGEAIVGQCERRAPAVLDDAPPLG